MLHLFRLDIFETPHQLNVRVRLGILWTTHRSRPQISSALARWPVPPRDSAKANRGSSRASHSRCSSQATSLRTTGATPRTTTRSAKPARTCIEEGESEDHELRLFEIGWGGDGLVFVREPLILMQRPGPIARVWARSLAAAGRPEHGSP